MFPAILLVMDKTLATLAETFLFALETGDELTISYVDTMVDAVCEGMSELVRHERNLAVRFTSGCDEQLFA